MGGMGGELHLSPSISPFVLAGEGEGGDTGEMRSGTARALMELRGKGGKKANRHVCSQNTRQMGKTPTNI